MPPETKAFLQMLSVEDRTGKHTGYADVVIHGKHQYIVEYAVMDAPTVEVG
jgi:hypothetical protein